MTESDGGAKLKQCVMDKHQDSSFSLRIALGKGLLFCLSGVTRDARTGAGECVVVGVRESWIWYEILHACRATRHVLFSTCRTGFFKTTLNDAAPQAACIMEDLDGTDCCVTENKL